jgi:hypothetical protein
MCSGRPFAYGGVGFYDFAWADGPLSQLPRAASRAGHRRRLAMKGRRPPRGGVSTLRRRTWRHGVDLESDSKPTGLRAALAVLIARATQYVLAASRRRPFPSRGQIVDRVGVVRRAAAIGASLDSTRTPRLDKEPEDEQADQRQSYQPLSAMYRWHSHHSADRSRANLDINFSQSEPYRLKEHGRLVTRYRLRVHNKGPADAANVEVVLRDIRPRPRSAGFQKIFRISPRQLPANSICSPVRLS